MSEEIPGYDQWKLSDGTPKSEVVHLCDYCNAPILEGQEAQYNNRSEEWFCDELCYMASLREDVQEALNELVDLQIEFEILTEEVVKKKDE